MSLGASPLLGNLLESNLSNDWRAMNEQLPKMSLADYQRALGFFAGIDRNDLAVAALNDSQLDGILLSRANELSLVYRSTGKLRPIPAKILLGKL